MKKEYVMGLVFNPKKTEILLLLKNHGPATIVDKWNGIGGKVEPDENPAVAMFRELDEETGINDSARIHVRKFHELHIGQYALVHVYNIINKDFGNHKQLEEESLAVFNVNALPPNMAPSMRFLIAASLEQGYDIGVSELLVD